ncbi:hypothetical protein EJ08DRAFT_730691 [Tothia fuscella]|uniref:Ubiquinol-cytochrome c chaperone domain-containing protein n=1 Tax=Tothia fuscella TaxID=1048955 RepID=A0A9P4P0J1_9PEZI|nr:hypothetical protein EJ08DRAFT_730691 [Tothia fuscella]
MASKNACKVCLRALRNRSPQSIQSHPISNSRLINIYHPSTSISIRNFSRNSRFQAVPEVTSTDNQEPANPLAKGDLLKDAPTAISLAKQLRKRATGATETYVAYGSTEALFKICAQQADYDVPQVKEKVPTPISESGEELGVGEGWWYKDVYLTPTFNTWAQVTFLHMYILTVRFRLFPPDHAPSWHQHLLDHFFFEAERRMTELHGLVSGGVRARYLKDLFIQWRGILAAYDEGLVKGDAVLAAAVWRNIFKGAEDVDAVAVAMIVSYLRREVSGVAGLTDEEIASGIVEFGSPMGERNVVLMESHLMKTID